MAKLLACIIASLDVLAGAQSFLAKSAVKQQLASEILGRSDSVLLQRIEDEMRPMFAALPKSESGLLEMSTVRYALSRFFLKKYGWIVKGLDSAGESAGESSGAIVLKARAPAFILSLFEERLQGKGMGLHELAVFGATLAELIHAEAVGQLQNIYQVMNLPTVGPVDKHLARAAMNSFVVNFLLGGSMPMNSLQDLQSMQAKMDLSYPNQNATKMWMEDLKHAYIRERDFRRNPFIVHNSSFDEASAFVVQFGHNFGSFQNLECHELKQKLMDIEHVGSGRVLLSQFYSKALAGDWQFMESIDYMRNQGVLDESDAENPSVVIPNYLSSQMNCLTASEYYAVCCLNECNALFDKIEGDIAAPHGEAVRIAEVVANLQSDTIDAPRNLSSVLLMRLNEIAQKHGGRVPLHGRLFAQWMHHAYPRECPFPHVSGMVTPMPPREFAKTFGVEKLAVKREVLEHYASRAPKEAEDEDEVEEVELPWSHVEELVAEHKHGARSPIARVAIVVLQAIAAVAGLASFAIPLIRFFKDGKSNVQDAKRWV